MTKRRESRFDFRGATNLSYTGDALDRTEFRLSKNGRLGGYTGVETRDGTQRLHADSIGGYGPTLELNDGSLLELDDGSEFEVETGEVEDEGQPVRGLHQWFPPTGRTLVAVANGNLYERGPEDVEFSRYATPMNRGVRPHFQAHIIEGQPRLYIADGRLREWDGESFQTIEGAPHATRLAIYKTRMFALDGTKTLYWSRISQPREWGSPNGGQGNVETYDADELVNIAPTGGSLLLFKENSIARFTGISAENIRIDQETEGISSDIGAIAAGTVVRLEDGIFFLTDRGVHFTTESGVEPIGVKIETVFDESAMDLLKDAEAVYHKKRHEVWTFFAGAGETRNTVGWCFNIRTKGWYGPWDMGDTFDVASLSQFELSNGQENVALAGYDGFVRQGDTADRVSRDDRMLNGQGGVPIDFRVRWEEFFFGDPAQLKRLKEAQHLSADLGVNGYLDLRMESDMGGRQRARLRSRGPGIKQYLFRPGTYGRRMDMEVSDDSGEVVRINGMRLIANASERSV